jgi:hypothetical protein
MSAKIWKPVAAIAALLAVVAGVYFAARPGPHKFGAIGNTVNGDLLVLGNTITNGVIPGGNPAGYINDGLISAAAGIQYTKLQQQATIRESIQVYGSNPAATRKTVFICNGATGSILSIKVCVVQVLASGSFNVDVLKNGTTVLSATIAMSSTGGSGGTAYDKVAGTVTAPALVAGDVLEMNVTVSSPSGGGGAMCELVVKQDPQ